ncbi:hypothetical protein K8R47_00845 [archaeon]|nr:hypothetical protein [archaeon]
MRILFILFFIPLLLIACKTEEQDETIKEILNANKDIKEILENSELTITKLQETNTINEPYKSLSENITINDQLYVVEINNQNKGYITLIDLKNKEILKIYNLVQVNL